MTERFSGSDAMLLHMDRTDTPMHTLKTVVFDWTEQGRPLTREEAAAGVLTVLGALPRLRQRAIAAPGFPGRPFWVDDPDFDIDDHVDEVTADPPGDRRALDRIHTRLANERVDRDKALWAMTVVHGLEGNRQAVIARLHHAIVDGGGALNGMLLVSEREMGERMRKPAPPPEPLPSGRELQRRVLREAPRLLTDLPPMIRVAMATRKAKKAYRAAHPGIPRIPGGRRTFASIPLDDSRVCASIDLPLDDLRRVAKASGTTVNGVYHALIAAAFRDELLAHGDACETATVSFAIASDTEPTRVSGNHVTPTFARIAVGEADPVRRLELTSQWCAEAVEVQRLGDLTATGRWATYYCRIVPWVLRLVQHRIPFVPSHLLSANVRGPDHRRWAGHLEITDWISYAVVTNPGNINVTAHSYDDRFVIGLLVGHGVLPHPESFLERMHAELDTLAAHFGGDVAPNPPSPPEQAP